MEANSTGSLKGMGRCTTQLPKAGESVAVMDLGEDLAEEECFECLSSQALLSRKQVLGVWRETFPFAKYQPLPLMPLSSVNAVIR